MKLSEFGTKPKPTASIRELWPLLSQNEREVFRALHKVFGAKEVK